MTTKILIVDDSRIFRSALEAGLSGEKDIQIVGSVWNGIKAIEFIESTPPDLVTLDIEMPDMDGLETLEAIQKINATLSPDNQIGVIMLSSYTQKGADITVKALEMGAFDFIPKPEGHNLQENIKILCSQLLVKIRNYTSTHIPSALRKPHVSKQKKTRPISHIIKDAGQIDAILIGVSTGGPKALAELLPSLCEKIEIPVFIVQHMPPTFTQSLAKSLNIKCRYTVLEGRHNDYVQDRHAYIAPGGRHMMLTLKQQKVRINVNDLPPEKGCRPSVNMLFRSGATVYGRNVIAVILTGMGADGTEGASVLKKKGAFILAQDEESCVVWGMPGNAFASGNVDKVYPLSEIPGAIIEMLPKPVKSRKR